MQLVVYGHLFFDHTWHPTTSHSPLEDNHNYNKITIHHSYPQEWRTCDIRQQMGQKRMENILQFVTETTQPSV